jgi:cupin fold WbuC family metalloprotein
VLQKNDMVEVVERDTFLINKEWVERIKKKAQQHPKRRYRTCIHRDDGADVHEMLIAHTDQTYVRPHKHRWHRESLHVVEGAATIILFQDNGEIDTVWRIGEVNRGRGFFYSLAPEVFHMMIIESPDLVFKETTHGPFVAEDQIFADWAPSGGDVGRAWKYVDEVSQIIKNL